jgi:hypothetical protein
MQWKKYALSDSEQQNITMDDVLKLSFKRLNNELWLNTDQQVAPEVAEAGTEAKEPDWSRWVIMNTDKSKAGTSMVISVMPSYPDRPLIVRPEYPLRLIPGAKVLVFMRIPVFVSVYDESRKEPRLLTEFPSIQLSNTWFGSMTEGELCYWLKTRARTFPEALTEKPHLCTCPIHIVNSSDEELLVDKLCLRLDTLSIYEADGRLWSDQMNIFYKGEERFSDLAAAGKPPAQASGARLLRPPRKASSSNIAMRTFKALNQLHPFSVFS